MLINEKEEKQKKTKNKKRDYYLFSFFLNITMMRLVSLQIIYPQHSNYVETAVVHEVMQLEIYKIRKYNSIFIHSFLLVPTYCTNVLYDGEFGFIHNGTELF